MFHELQRKLHTITLFFAIRIVMLLRGLPGSGKSHLAKLIKNKETEIGGSGKVRILSIDDYFTSEVDADADKGTKHDVSDN